MINVLFLIPTLGSGGAEKVLVNLVNNMDQSKFMITVMTLYDEGVNRQFLCEGISYRSCMKRSFPGVAHILKLQSPKQLYHHYITGHYDFVISYLEGQTARIVSGCDNAMTKTLCWVHRTYSSQREAARLFRSKSEAFHCYDSFDGMVFVSNDVQAAFNNLFPLQKKGVVLYNTNQSEQILKLADLSISDIQFDTNTINICAMGSLIPVKGFERLISIHQRLCQEGHNLHTYILGEGEDKEKLVKQIENSGLANSVSLLGYHENPYPIIKQCDLFVCSSFSEGFSTAVTEALILGIPVITTKVSGMRELLGDNNEFGIITENNETALYNGLRELLQTPELLSHYKEKAIERGKIFHTENTVKAVQDYILGMRFGT